EGVLAISNSVLSPINQVLRFTTLRRLDAALAIIVLVLLGGAPRSGAAACQELLANGGFESAANPPAWTATSLLFGTPLCTLDACGNGESTVGPRGGSYWVWFGGVLDPQAVEIASVRQTVVIPSGTATLSFYLWIGKWG